MSSNLPRWARGIPTLGAEHPRLTRWSTLQVGSAMAAERAKKRRKLVLTPVCNSYAEFAIKYTHEAW